MKKPCALILAIALLCVLCACGSSGSNPLDKILNEPNTLDRMAKAFGTDYKYDDFLLDSGSVSATWQNVKFFGYSGSLYLRFQDDGYYTSSLKYVRGNLEDASVISVQWSCEDAGASQETVEKRFVDSFDRQYGSHTADGRFYLWIDAQGNQIRLDIWEDSGICSIDIFVDAPNRR